MAAEVGDHYYPWYHPQGHITFFCRLMAWVSEWKTQKHHNRFSIEGTSWKIISQDVQIVEKETTIAEKKKSIYKVFLHKPLRLYGSSFNSVSFIRFLIFPGNLNQYLTEYDRPIEIRWSYICLMDYYIRKTSSKRVWVKNDLLRTVYIFW